MKRRDLLKAIGIGAVIAPVVVKAEEPVHLPDGSWQYVPIEFKTHDKTYQGAARVRIDNGVPVRWIYPDWYKRLMIEKKNFSGLYG